MILVPVLPVLEARYVLMDLASAPAARKNATVHASALPNAAAGVHLLITVITAVSYTHLDVYKRQPYYNKVEQIVQEEMDKFAKISGRQYKTIEYVGPADADQVIVIMGSGAETVDETINYLNNNGYNVGLLKVRLYRPFPAKSFIAALPKSVKVVNVLDRTKESGSIGEPLYLDVVATLTQAFANNEIAAMPDVYKRQVSE